MTAGPLWSLDTETLLATEVEPSSSYVLSTDLLANKWFAIKSGGTITVSYREDGVTVEAGSFSPAATGTTGLFSVPKAAGAGCWLLEVDDDGWVVRLYDVETTGVTLIGTPNTTGVQDIGGLCWAPDMNLLFVGTVTSTSLSIAFKIRTSDASVVAPFPDGLGASEQSAGNRRAVLQLGPNGYAYCYSRDVTGDGTDYICRFTTDIYTGLADFEHVVNLQEQTGSAMRCLAFTVMADGTIQGTASGIDGGLAYHFYYDGTTTTWTRWDTLVDAGFDPFYQTDATAPAVWQTATAVYFTGKLQDTETAGVARFTRVGVFESATESTQLTSSMGNSVIGNNADQARYQFDNVVEPQLAEAPPPDPPVETNLWFMGSMLQVNSLPGYVFSVDKTDLSVDTAFTSSANNTMSLVCRDFDGNSFVGEANLTGSSFLLKMVSPDGTVSSTLTGIADYRQDFNSVHGAGSLDGTGGYMLIRRKSTSAGNQANLYSLDATGATLLSALSITNHAPPIGLAWNPDGDLVTMALETLGGGAYRWSVIKINPVDGSIRSGYPLAWTSQCVDSPSDCSGLQLRSNGQLYVAFRTTTVATTIWRFAVSSAGYTTSPTAVTTTPSGTSTPATSDPNGAMAVNSSGDILFIPYRASTGPHLWDGAAWTALECNNTDPYIPATGAGDQFDSFPQVGGSRITPTAAFIGTISDAQKWCVLGYSRRFYGPMLRIYDDAGVVESSIPLNLTGLGTALQASDVQTINPERGAWGGGDVTVTAIAYDSSSGENYSDLQVGDQVVALNASLGGIMQLWGTVSSSSWSDPTLTVAITPSSITAYVSSPFDTIQFGDGAGGVGAFQRTQPNTFDPDGYLLNMAIEAQT